MEKIKIMFFNRCCNIGGVEKALYDIVSHIDKTKFDVTIMLRSKQGEMLDEYLKLQNEGCHIRFCFDHLKPGKTFFKKAYNVITTHFAEK